MNLAVTDLRVDGLAEPLGLDTGAPAFSWRLAGAGRGRAQSAYRLVVARECDPVDDPVGGPVDENADENADESVGAGRVWDSGVVTSAATYDIPYAGAELRPRTRYQWRVRVADESGAWSGWSPAHWFETGLIDATGWTADWIGTPAVPGSQRLPSLDNVPRIWVADRLGPSASATGAFRTRFAVPGGARPLSAWLVIGGGSGVEVHLNGVPVPGETRDGAFVADAGDLVGPGENVLAIRSGGSGLCVRLEVVVEGRPVLPQLVPVAGETAVTVTSSGRWRTSDDPAAGFERPGFDDSGWALAEETGLHGDPPHGRAAIGDRPSPYLRREFDVPSPVRRARLYATALGVYETHLNGVRVGADHLAPGWTDYRHRVTYQTYDVTALVSEGRNALGAILADGWYAGNISWFGPFQYGRRLAFRAELEILHDDGTVTRVCTDPEWRAGSGAIRYADLQNGERQDLAAEPSGWTAPGFDDSGWAAAVPVSPPGGRLTSAVAPPIRVHEELAPVAVWERRPGVWLADFGQNVVGWVRLTGRASRDRPVVLRHAEVLDHEGELHLANLRSARATDEFLPRAHVPGPHEGRGTSGPHEGTGTSGPHEGTGTPGPHEGGAAAFETETFEPRFTFHGFRYVEVSGLHGAPESITARVAYAAMEPAGEFACSDERLVRLQRNIVWGQRGNFLAIPTDCPQRDERLGWTGDIWAFAPTALFNYDAAAFLRSWLADVVDAQGDDGAVTHVAPDVLSGRGLSPNPKEAGSPGWGDALVMLPWTLHRLRGDTGVAAACFEPMRRWLGYLERRSECGVFPEEGFGDWLSIGAETPKRLVGTAIFALSARQLASLAAALGRDGDERELLELYGRVRKAFRAAFVEGPGVVASGTQTAYVLAIAAGLLEEHELPRAAARLAGDIEARGGHLSTGFLGTPYLLDALTSTGRLDVAYRLLTQDTFPSWLYPVVHGDATTMWERWDSWSHHRGLQDPGMNSFNHYAYGAVGDWMYRTVGGLAPGSPGYADIVVRPRPGGGITWATTAHRTPHGRVEIAWRQEGAEFALDVVVPPNTRAEVHLPAPPERVTEGGRPASEAEGVTFDRLADASEGHSPIGESGEGREDGEGRGDGVGPGDGGGRAGRGGAVYRVGSGSYAFRTF
ncbi:glycoside hydrolase family 78 protein [Nonomuraea zeae]|uniref:alpha-L-rhamnosidase n=1 Tax=Nonomuraea zeae TaxID=1642303 RepID=A0A5S4H067_9ACTN|nr:glycoside hydrolase family 78 protein [Nonomuraea zeae]TMR38566.1 rhamnosidase [Nonomuraea zeae]